MHYPTNEMSRAPIGYVRNAQLRYMYGLPEVVVYTTYGCKIYVRNSKTNGTCRLSVWLSANFVNHSRMVVQQCLCGLSMF